MTATTRTAATATTTAPGSDADLLRLQGRLITNSDRAKARSEFQAMVTHFAAEREAREAAEAAARAPALAAARAELNAARAALELLSRHPAGKQLKPPAEQRYKRAQARLRALGG